MQYFSNCKNPLSRSCETALKNLVDPNFIKHDCFVQLLPLENIQTIINNDLKQYNLEIDNILIFFYKPFGIPETHIDYSNDSIICKSSLVIPWILHEQYSVYWSTGNYELYEEYYNNIKYNKLKWNSDEKLCFEASVSKPIILRTDIPHGIKQPKSDLLLATFRFKGNPDFDMLYNKFAVE